MNTSRAWIRGGWLASVLPHYSLVDILNLVGARAPQGIHSALAHESRLRLSIWKPAGIRFTLYPLYTIFRVQQLDKRMRAVGWYSNLISVHLKGYLAIECRSRESLVFARERGFVFCSFPIPATSRSCSKRGSWKFRVPAEFSVESN